MAFRRSPAAPVHCAASERSQWALSAPTSRSAPSVERPAARPATARASLCLFNTKARPTCKPPRASRAAPNTTRDMTAPVPLVPAINGADVPRFNGAQHRHYSPAAPSTSHSRGPHTSCSWRRLRDRPMRSGQRSTAIATAGPPRHSLDPPARVTADDAISTHSFRPRSSHLGDRGAARPGGWRDQPAALAVRRLGASSWLAIRSRARYRRLMIVACLVPSACAACR